MQPKTINRRKEAELRAAARREWMRYMIVSVTLTLLIGIAIGYVGLGSARPRRACPTAVISTAWSPPRVPGVAVPPTPRSRPTATPELLQIYVSGAVTTAQVISVPKGSLVVDAVDAVGGAAPDADLDALNLAEPLNNYQHVLVPTRSTPAPESTPPPAAEVTTPDRVNINTASAAELETLRHIGPSRAQNILAYREAHGPFNAIEEIKNVKGIGDATFADLAPLITVSP